MPSLRIFELSSDGRRARPLQLSSESWDLGIMESLPRAVFGTATAELVEKRAARARIAKDFGRCKLWVTRYLFVEIYLHCSGMIGARDWMDCCKVLRIRRKNCLLVR
jgi:hypothetical protein